ncbi:MAG TPA: DUF3168 domain-containing protein [Pirellulales bacterium]|jgi:L-alanine-DL-glutamate epimerase-like enolase superfamily enzyme|nr:DUF3168 domain-containing protein [Pirellulales bacterium]
MTFAGAIHARWAADSSLAGLLPAARLFTGPVRGDSALPYAVLLDEQTTLLARTNRGSDLLERTFRIQVWAAELDAGLSVVAALQSAFDESSFTFDGGAVLDCRLVSTTEMALATGAWRLECAYSALVKLG